MTTTFRELLCIAGASDPATIAALAPKPFGTTAHIATDDGFIASAMETADGRVFINCFGTQSDPQGLVDLLIYADEDPALVPAYAEALAWAKGIVAQAEGKSVYVTGFSLGGTMSQFLAERLKLPGAGFAGAGVPHYTADPKVTNFTTFVCYGDFWGQYGTDTAVRPPFSIIRQDHVGRLIMLGDPKDATTIKRVYSEAAAATLMPWMTSLVAQYKADMQVVYSVHAPNHYMPLVEAHSPATV